MTDHKMHLKDVEVVTVAGQVTLGKLDLSVAYQLNGDGLNLITLPITVTNLPENDSLVEKLDELLVELKNIMIKNLGGMNPDAIDGVPSGIVDIGSI